MEQVRLHVRKFRQKVENLKLDGFYNASVFMRPVELVRTKADLWKSPAVTAEFAAAFEADLKILASRPKTPVRIFKPYNWAEKLERILEGY